MRAAVLEARDAGTNLAFLGANTMYWRIRLAPAASGPARVEHDLIGMQYECYPVDTDYVIATPGWWGFEGTGVRRGDRIEGMVGGEADRVDPDRRLPRPLQVLSHSPYPCRGVATSAQAVYYTTESGAGVFAAGTLRWGCALVERCDRPLGGRTTRFARTVTATVVRTYARGPVGERHPARDNVVQFDLPLLNTVPAS